MPTHLFVAYAITCSLLDGKSSLFTSIHFLRHSTHFLAMPVHRTAPRDTFRITHTVSSCSICFIVLRFMRSLPQITTRAISSVLFDSSKTAPATVYVPTLVSEDGKNRFPCFEAVLGRGAPLHQCTVAVADNTGVRHKYLVVTQTGEGLPCNRALQDINFDMNGMGLFSS